MVGIQLISKVGKKGQVVIPKPVRKQLGITPNTEVVFDVENGKVVIKRRKNALKMFEDFVNAVEEKKIPPKHIDWDEEHYSQFE